MQFYYGINPITTGGASSPGVVKFPFPGGFGSYTLAADCIADGDLRNAGNLDPGEQGNRDAIAWLTWRSIDWVSGFTDGGAFTAAVTLSSAMTWNGAHLFKNLVSISSGGFLLLRTSSPASYIGNSGVLHVGDPAAIDGTGTIAVESGSLVDVKSGGFVKVESGGEIEVKSGGEILVDAGGHLYTSMPASSAAVLANDIVSLGVAKAYAQITTHSGAAVVDDGYNVSNSFSYPTFSAAASIKVTWATPFASGNYSVVVTSTAPAGGGSPFIVAFVIAKTANDCTIGFYDLLGAVIWNPQTANFTFHLTAHGRQ